MWSWADASEEYLPWLSRKTGKTYRLLTEAEWEYAARAGARTKDTWREDIGQGRANCNGCGSQWDNKQTAPVGSFTPNAFGVHDMRGNVNEWVEDCYQDGYNGAPTDGSARSSTSCTSRVVRGGAWDRNPIALRSAYRNGFSPGAHYNSQGFRVARTLAP